MLAGLLRRKISQHVTKGKTNETVRGTQWGALSNFSYLHIAEVRTVTSDFSMLSASETSDWELTSATGAMNSSRAIEILPEAVPANPPASSTPSETNISQARGGQPPTVAPHDSTLTDPELN